MKIEEIKADAVAENTLGHDDIVFLDAREDPFRIYGLYEPKTMPEFMRIPKEVAKNTSQNVDWLSTNTAGGRVRFATDSPYIAIRCTMKSVTHFSHMPLTGTGGFDLYVHCDEDGHDTFQGEFVPPYDMKDGFSNIVNVRGGKMKTYTIHFPLYNDVTDLEIGVRNDSCLDFGAEYRPIPPVVYYGSSITQGGCASRPGNAYQNIISARNNVDHINLGFSGAAKAEDAIVDYIAGLNMSILVMDYDHNAPSNEYLKNTHEKMYRKIREKHPDLPIIIVSRPNAGTHIENFVRNQIMYDTFFHAIGEGDTNVFYIDGYTLFEPEYHDICTVDGLHPTDAGFIGMARVIGREVNRILRHTEW